MMATEEAKARIYDNISLAQSAGVFKLHSGGLGWRGKETSKGVTCQTPEIQSLLFLRGAHTHELRVQLTSGAYLVFQGFSDGDYDSLSEFCRTQCRLEVKDMSVCVKGWNWGDATVESNMLTFNVDRQPAFQVPLTEVTTCSLQNKTELALEFRPTDDSVDPSEDTLVEMRFYVPNTEDNPTAAEHLETLIKERAQLGIVSGDCYASFSEVPFLTPRGRYTLDLFPTFIRMHGKTYDYKLPYDTLLRLFLLPKPDEQHVLLVLGLDPPLRQGQTRYPFLVMQFLREGDDMDLELKMNEETFAKLSSAHQAIQKSYKATPMFDVLSALLKALSSRPIIVPGSYRTRNGQPALKCSIKASDGYLYLLEKSFLFIPKPTVFLRYVDIAHMETNRLDVNASSSSASRSFDLKVHMKTGLEYQFSNIAREEFPALKEFMQAKNLPLAAEKKSKVTAVDIGLDSSSESSSEEGHARKRAASDEDEESEDEDFNPDDDEDDVAEEYDEDYQSDGAAAGEEKDAADN